MKAKDFKGIIPPILTSFTKDGEIDEKAWKELIEFMLPHVQGFYPIGTYGCGPFMTLADRKRAAEIIIDQVNERVPVIIHVGAVDTKSTVELSKHAEKAGAAAVGAIAPYYTPLNEEELYEHYLAIMEAVDIPVFLYNNPHISKQILAPSLIKRLADKGLRGIKDSSFDIVNYYNYKRAVSDYDDFNVIIGTEAILNAAFQMGAQGAVTGVANVYPELIQEQYQAVINGDIKKANDIQLKVLKVREITKLGQTVPTMHAILELRGVNCGTVKAPYLPVIEDVKKRVKTALKDLGLL
jgi:dihydrodipicolinate synthase/N-acetylneuraminate lyase